MRMINKNLTKSLNAFRKHFADLILMSDIISLRII